MNWLRLGRPVSVSKRATGAGASFASRRSRMSRATASSIRAAPEAASLRCTSTASGEPSLQRSSVSSAPPVAGDAACRSRSSRPGAGAPLEAGGERQELVAPEAQQAAGGGVDVHEAAPSASIRKMASPLPSIAARKRRSSASMRVRCSSSPASCCWWRRVSSYRTRFSNDTAIWAATVASTRSSTSEKRSRPACPPGTASRAPGRARPAARQGRNAPADGWQAGRPRAGRRPGRPCAPRCPCPSSVASTPALGSIGHHLRLAVVAAGREMFEPVAGAVQHADAGVARHAHFARDAAAGVDHRVRVAFGSQLHAQLDQGGQAQADRLQAAERLGQLARHFRQHRRAAVLARHCRHARDHAAARFDPVDDVADRMLDRADAGVGAHGFFGLQVRHRRRMGAERMVHRAQDHVRVGGLGQHAAHAAVGGHLFGLALAVHGGVENHGDLRPFPGARAAR